MTKIVNALNYYKYYPNGTEVIATSLKHSNKEIQLQKRVHQLKFGKSITKESLMTAITKSNTSSEGARTSYQH